MVGLKDVWVRDGAHLREGDHLLVPAEDQEGLVLHAYGPVVASCGVRVVAENVDDVIAGVPRWGDGVPQPDQVAELVVLRKARVHELVQCLAALWAKVTPPEPRPVGFVKGAPEDRDLGGL